MMILTCPKCATRFYVEAERIGVAGRRVMCDECGHAWIAFREGRMDTEEGPVHQDPARETQLGPIDPPLADQVEGAPLFVKRPTDRAAKPARARRWWIGVLLLIVAVVAGLLIFERPIVRAYPASRAIYAPLGMEPSGGARG